MGILAKLMKFGARNTGTPPAPDIVKIFVTSASGGGTFELECGDRIPAGSGDVYNVTVRLRNTHSEPFYLQASLKTPASTATSQYLFMNPGETFDFGPLQGGPAAGVAQVIGLSGNHPDNMIYKTECSLNVPEGPYTGPPPPTFQCSQAGGSAKTKRPTLANRFRFKGHVCGFNRIDVTIHGLLRPKFMAIDVGSRVGVSEEVDVTSEPFGPRFVRSIEWKVSGPGAGIANAKWWVSNSLAETKLE